MSFHSHLTFSATVEEQEAGVVGLPQGPEGLAVSPDEMPVFLVQGRGTGAGEGGLMDGMPTGYYSDSDWFAVRPA